MAIWKSKNRLRYWRRMRGLTQEELARRLGVSAQTICFWEQEYRTPTIAHAEQVAKLLRVSIRELFPHIA